MACLSKKLNLALKLAEMGTITAGAAVGAETVVIPYLAASVLLEATAEYELALDDLHSCLEEADRDDDADKVSQHLNAIKGDAATLRNAYEMIQAGLGMR